VRFECATYSRHRLDDPDDIVRLEIEAALARDVRVIPILVGDAVMPGRGDLPESLAGLTRRNALFIRYESFRYDAERLVAAIERVLPASGPAAITSALDAHGIRSTENAIGEVAQGLPETISPGLPGSSLTPNASPTPSPTGPRRHGR
jgi:hypothetical protein